MPDRVKKNRKPPPKERARWGGPRPNSGRKSRERLEQEMQQQSDLSKQIAAFKTKSLRERFPTMPLEFLLAIINDVDPKTGEPRNFKLQDQLQAAARAAPFIHPKLSNVNLQARQKYSIDLDKLDDEELAQFEHLLLKSQVMEGEQTPEDVASEIINGEYEMLPPGANNGGNETSH